MQEAHMLKIGLTGGIASGKSTVLDFLKKKDVPYILVRLDSLLSVNYLVIQ